MKLYNTKRKLSISPTFKILGGAHRKWGEIRYLKEIAILYKDGHISRYSQDPDSLHYSSSFPYRFDKTEIFGVATKRNRDDSWDFHTHVYDHKGNYQPLHLEAREQTLKGARKAGIQAVKDHYVRVNQILMQAPQERLEAELVEALKSHDWHYAMSDDHSYYVRGQASWKQIKKMMREMEDSDRAEELFRKYAPEGISGKGIIPKQRPIVVGDLFLKKDPHGFDVLYWYEVLKVNRRSLVLREKNFKKSTYFPREYLGDAFRVPYPQKKWNVIKHKGITLTLKGTQI